MGGGLGVFENPRPRARDSPEAGDRPGELFPCYATLHWGLTGFGGRRVGEDEGEEAFGGLLGVWLESLNDKEY